MNERIETALEDLVGAIRQEKVDTDKRLQAALKELADTQEANEIGELIMEVGAYRAKAEEEGLDLIDWIRQTLTAGVEGTTIPVKHEVASKLRRIAEFRSIPLDTLTKGKRFTRIIERGMEGEKF